MGLAWCMHGDDSKHTGVPWIYIIMHAQHQSLLEWKCVCCAEGPGRGTAATSLANLEPKRCPVCHNPAKGNRVKFCHSQLEDGTVCVHQFYGGDGTAEQAVRRPIPQRFESPSLSGVATKFQGLAQKVGTLVLALLEVLYHLKLS